MKADDWVIVRMSKGASGGRIALVRAVREAEADVLIYRRKPERMEAQTIDRRCIKGAAPRCERLRCAQEIVEIGNLRKRRLAIGVTQKELAKIIGINEQTLRSAELGRRRTHRNNRKWILEGMIKAEAMKRTA